MSFLYYIVLSRYHLCVQRGWERFGEDLLQESNASSSRGTNIVSTNGISIKPATCRWKSIYMHALSLEKNWAQGKYTVAPLLRGHREPITCMDCNGNFVKEILLLISFLLGCETRIPNWQSIIGWVTCVFHFLFTLGSTLVSGSSDNTLRVWDVKTHQCVLVLDSPHTDSVRCVQLQVCYNKYAASLHSILVVWCARSFLSPCFMMLIVGYRNHGRLMFQWFL